MYVFKDLQSLLNVSVKWEKELKDLYDVAALGVRHPKSKELVTWLLEKQEKVLSILSDIDVKRYGKGEFVKYTRENHTEDLIPRRELNRDSSPGEIIEYIREYERGLKDYYREIAGHLVDKGQKELFESLETLKDTQLEALENFIREQLNLTV